METAKHGFGKDYSRRAAQIDAILRQKAAQRAHSLNQVILDELAAATGGRQPKADFSDLVGRWTPTPAFR
jgi:hypothetical protein